MRKRVRPIDSQEIEHAFEIGAGGLGGIAVVARNGALTAAADVGSDDSVVLREEGPDGVPCQRVLGKTMDKENGGAAAGVAEVDVDIGELETLMLPLVKGDEGGGGGGG